MEQVERVASRLKNVVRNRPELAIGVLVLLERPVGRRRHHQVDARVGHALHAARVACCGRPRSSTRTPQWTSELWRGEPVDLAHAGHQGARSVGQGRTGPRGHPLGTRC